MKYFRETDILNFLAEKLREKGFEGYCNHATLVRFDNPKTEMFININGDIILKRWNSKGWN